MDKFTYYHTPSLSVDALLIQTRAAVNESLCYLLHATLPGPMMALSNIMWERDQAAGRYSRYCQQLQFVECVTKSASLHDFLTLENSPEV